MNHINKRNSKVLMAVVVVGLSFATIPVSKTIAQSGGTYDLTWSTIDGGGGRSTGGAFILEGTIGQPDAGLLSGGEYVLAGGFWPATSWCIVDLPDLATFCNYWLIGSGAPQGDFNNNGKCDLHDFNRLATY
ncbi:MAG: hypothetical protein GY869_07345, partial [Planctomycetes bacterium]|nr:hypothetical protein [Planctomycetota bacterium]